MEMPSVLVVGDALASAEFEERLVPFPVLYAEDLPQAAEQLMSNAPFVVIIGGPNAKEIGRGLVDAARAMMSEVVFLAELGGVESAVAKVEKLMVQIEDRRRGRR
jgi:hypothetical protein